MSLGYTGRLMEEELFSASEKESFSSEYLPYKESIEEAKENQPYEDPSDPEPRFSNDLHATVCEMLGLDDYSKLKIYTAIGSHLDVYHGVDAFFEVEINGKIHRVTLDVTFNKNKEDGGKADVVFLVPREGLDPGSKEDKEEYRNLLDDVALRVAEIFKNNIS